ncbi:MAG: selenium metabolism-associated LysR family transcriptional regulator [Candidatus Rokuibacteriota bacterium]
MTLRQFEAFLAVARERSFSRAGQRLHLSQPTLSEHIAELERVLETSLFVRRGREVTLTEAGRVFHEHAGRVVSAAEEARQAVADLGGLTRGSLLVGASTTPGVYVLPAIIAAFRTRHPGIELKLQIANSRTIEERVRANNLDLGVVGGHVLGAGERCLAAGLDDELVLIVPPQHPWATRRDIGVASLCDQPLLMREEGSATRYVTERALQQAGLHCKSAMELDHTEAIKQAVMAGLGVALVSVHAVRGEVATRRLASLRVRGLPLRRHFHVIHDEDRALTGSATAFLELLGGYTSRKAVLPR